MNRTFSVLMAVVVMLSVSAVGCKTRSNSLDYPTETGERVSPGNYSGSIEHDGYTRTFKYHVPVSWNWENEQALVFVLHGGGGTSDSMVSVTLGGFDILSESDGFIVVYPDAWDKNWNDGRGIDRYEAMAEDIDDVGFILTLIEHFDNRANIDRSRVYATGISNGSFMSHRLGIEASDSFAAIAPVVGQMTENLSLLTPQGPMPVCVFVGLDDPLIPAEGGNISVPFLGSTGYGVVVSASETVDFWVNNNGCNPVPVSTSLPDINPDGTSVIRYVYENTTNGAEVVYYEIAGGGHTWPNGDQYLGAWLVGKVCRDIDGNTLIWNFFKSHSK